MIQMKLFNVVIGALFLCLFVSCSEGTNRIVDGELTKTEIAGEMHLGAWKLSPVSDAMVPIIEPVRSSQVDVTKWAQVKVLAASWDEVLRNWTVTVQVINPTPFSGYGVQAIFTQLGGKELRWPDGFRWLDLNGDNKKERYPFFAIEKTTKNRIFEGFHTSTQDLTFHFPVGINKWIPIEFFLDAYLKEPRPDPMVEEMGMSYFPPPCFHSTVTARVGDHQSPGDALEVWVDLSSAGGSDHEPLYDDGAHDDGAAGDGVFGAKFSAGSFGTLYTFTVYAKDPQGNTGENDIFYSPIHYPPLPPVQFESLLSGQLCNISEETLKVIDDEAQWNDFWIKFDNSGTVPPSIDFSKKRVVVVCIGTRPDDCFSVQINAIDWTSENCGWKVSYTETVPGPNCKCNDMLTSPYHLVLVNKAGFDIMFSGDIYEDPCGGIQDPCLDLFHVASGAFGCAAEESMTVIMDQTQLADWWKKSVGTGDPPVIDFVTQMAFGVTMGAKPSSGYFPSIDSACINYTEMMEITVGWHIPGEDCITLPVITYPFVLMSSKKDFHPYYWHTYDDVYSCK